MLAYIDARNIQQNVYIYFMSCLVSKNGQIYQRSVDAPQKQKSDEELDVFFINFMKPL